MSLVLPKCSLCMQLVQVVASKLPEILPCVTRLLQFNLLKHGVHHRVMDEYAYFHLALTELRVGTVAVCYLPFLNCFKNASVER